MMILKNLLKTQMIWKMSTKILQNIIQERNIVSIVFDDMIADMINNEKLNPTVTELFIRDRKLNISIDFITQPYFRLDTKHFFIK